MAYTRHNYLVVGTQEAVELFVTPEPCGGPGTCHICDYDVRYELGQKEVLDHSAEMRAQNKVLRLVDGRLCWIAAEDI